VGSDDGAALGNQRLHRPEATLGLFQKCPGFVLGCGVDRADPDGLAPGETLLEDV
jgi:hypothetical protein